MRRRGKIAWGITGGVTALLLAGVGTLSHLSRPLSRSEVDQAIEERLRSAVDAEPTLSSALLTVYSGPEDRLLQYAVGTERAGSDVPARTDSTYHSASVGKSMLATVYGQLVDEGTLTFDAPVATWLDAETLAGLFVVDGTDHAPEVTIGQLLSHTSGVADYFEGPVTSGTPILERVAHDPDHLFTPQELVAFSRDHQEPVGSPGETFAYSDTGYVLLGLALEEIEGAPYAQVLDDRLFVPLGMADSHLLIEFGEAAEILSLTADGQDISQRNALSVDWAGGGVVTTMDDLLLFLRALTGGELVSEETLATLTAFEHDVDKGIGYGMGMMQFRFSDLSPLLFAMSDLQGAVGATGTYALYDPSGDTYYIANFGSLDYRQKAIEELVQVRLLVDRLKD
ncbi:serine hydrolase domain-containing protein [Oerskovia jenensis]|uniref:D-alanyl-D-alanine carboxypeptidase n=1 Tax=Oerskovia jenensis TaxID=162169 RepID=A0ABS2LAV6_9CELL|nr:serine hydrolase domain-containing protein [Oerskovia jenensis]MBM7477228.1 D-alanyl-D-alanine carboxypeptidase [Oerskovia jenensis]